jgi:hypothetical protein
VRTLLIALGLVAASAPAAPALELRVVTSINAALWGQIYLSARAESEALVRDHTMFGNLGPLDPELLEKLPYGPDVVMYFAENGDLLAWSDKSEVVEVGYWEIMDGGTSRELCIRFGYFGLDSVCSSADTANAQWLTQSTPGNPFGLVAGAPVPGPLGASPADLRAMAASLP